MKESECPEAPAFVKFNPYRCADDSYVQDQSQCKREYVCPDGELVIFAEQCKDFACDFALYFSMPSCEYEAETGPRDFETCGCICLDGSEAIGFQTCKKEEAPI